MNFVARFFHETLYLWLDISPYLLLGLAVAGLLHLFLGKDFIVRHLGRPGPSSIIKATLLGIPLPLCSCGVMPVASSLEKDGAHRSSILAFMVSTPTTGVDSMLATYSLMGPLFAVFRPLAALISGLAVGLLDYFFGGKSGPVRAMPVHTHAKLSAKEKIKEFFSYAFDEIPRDIGKWLLVGTLLGGFISALIPAGLLSRYLPFPLDFAAALAVGIPLYVCATGSIPIGVSLIHSGFSPGAALVFLIAGPATNTIALSFVRLKMGSRSFYLYLASIALTAILMGLALNAVWPFAGSAKLTAGAGDMLPLWLRSASALILLALIFKGAWRPNACAISAGPGAQIVIAVPDIHCRHCQMTIEAALKGLPGAAKVWVDVEKKAVYISGRLDRQTAIDRIKQAGYNPQ